MRSPRASWLLAGYIACVFAPATQPPARPLLLVHIPKTGGTNIEALLGLRDVPGGVIGEPAPECAGIPVMDHRHEKHDTAAQARAHYTLDEWNDAYKLSIIRNPWDQKVSYWNMLMCQVIQNPVWRPVTRPLLEKCGCGGPQAWAPDTAPGGIGRQHVGSRALQPDTEHGGLADISVNDASLPCSFTHYLTHCSFITESLSIAGVQEHDALAGGVVDEQSASQLGWHMSAKGIRAGAEQLTDDNSLVDFVGRTENLESHLREAMVAAGNDRQLATDCAAALTSETDCDLNHEEYTLYYTPETLKFVDQATGVSLDGRAFNYTFGEEAPIDIAYQRA